MRSFMELSHLEIFLYHTGKRCRHIPSTSTRTERLKSSRLPANFSLSYMELWTNPVPNSIIFSCRKKSLYYHKDKKSVNVVVWSKFFRENKKPWLQTKDRRLLVRLAWQSRSPGYFIDFFVTLAFARLLPLALFPLSEIHSSVIWSVSACLCFHDTTFASLLKGDLPKIFPNKTPTKPNYCTPFRTFRLWHGGRAALSVKGAQQFWGNVEKAQFYKIPARPRGADLWQSSPCSPCFGCAERYGSVPKMYRFCYGFSAAGWENVLVLYVHRACCSLP